MKKQLILFGAIALCGVFASCQKENAVTVDPQEGESIEVSEIKVTKALDLTPVYALKEALNNPALDPADGESDVIDFINAVLDALPLEVDINNFFYDDHHNFYLNGLDFGDFFNIYDFNLNYNLDPRASSKYFDLDYETLGGIYVGGVRLSFNTDLDTDSHLFKGFEIAWEADGGVERITICRQMGVVSGFTLLYEENYVADYLEETEPFSQTYWESELGIETEKDNVLGVRITEIYLFNDYVRIETNNEEDWADIFIGHDYDNDLPLGDYVINMSTSHLLAARIAVAKFLFGRTFGMSEAACNELCTQLGEVFNVGAEGSLTLPTITMYGPYPACYENTRSLCWQKRTEDYGSTVWKPTTCILIPELMWGEYEAHFFSPVISFEELKKISTKDWTTLSYNMYYGRL